MSESSALERGELARRACRAVRARTRAEGDEGDEGRCDDDELGEGAYADEPSCELVGSMA